MGRLFLVLIVAFGVLAGCGGDVSKRQGVVIAKVGDRTITRDMIESRLADMPPQIRAEFESPEGRDRLLEGLIDEEAFLLAALEIGLDKNLEVLRLIDEERRRILIRAYYEREVFPYTNMDDDDLRSYYDENIETNFRVPNQSVVTQVVLGTEKEAEMVRGLLAGGAKWNQIVADYCIDEPTTKRAGKIGPVAENSSLIPLVGASFDMMKCIDSLTIGTLSPVVRTGRGFHVFTVTERIPEGYLPFDKMKSTIRRTFAKDFSNKVRNEKVAHIRDKFGVEIFPVTGLADIAIENPKDEKKRELAKKLFEMAQLTSDPRTRIKYYKEIVQDHPGDEHAMEAQFMIGFVYSEELNDFDLARDAFQTVLDREDCPEDLRDSATWMLQNMGQEPPEFETN